MNETALTWLVFILAFGGMVIIHEFGHFIVARLCGIEVEEFGLGLPTPGALVYWINRGYLFLRSDKRIEIPRNFHMPVAWNDLVGMNVKITADSVNDRLVMRTIEWVKPVKNEWRSSDPLKMDHIYVNQEGTVTPSQDEKEKNISNKIVKVGKENGGTELVEVISEVHPGTRFTINWLPLGGFVRPKGENDPNIEGGLAAASPWKRLAVLVAGPLMNLVSAVVIFSIIFLRAGVPDDSRILVSSITPDEPAALAGFQVDDIFISGNGQPIGSFEDLRNIVDANENNPVVFLVEREGEQVELVATPLMNEEAERVMIGVGLGSPFVPVSSWTEVVPLGFEATWSSVKALVYLPVQMIQGNLTPEESRIVGPVGIFRIFQQTVSQDVQSSQVDTSASTDPLDKPIRTLSVIASISISLGIFNLFPFPALDGGRILFVLPELLFRRRVPHEKENFVHGVAMMLLLMFMFYIIIKDILNPIPITIP